MAIEFIGHKAQLLDFLLPRFDSTAKGQRGSALDLFCGTAAVSKALKQSGYTVIANDHLQVCSIFAEADLLNNGSPAFAGLGELQAQRRHNEQISPYQAVIAFLNKLKPVRGFFHRTYSPEAEKADGVRRMYFTAANAGRIDAIRGVIGRWNSEGRLSRGENAILLRDLALAANEVANTAGTYGCYLKHWKNKALKPLSIRVRVPDRSARKHTVHCMDALQVAATCSANVVYADPPYTKRQYAAYYHVLETIVRGDNPAVSGSTGLRPWREKESAFCYKRRAPEALEALVGTVNCEHFFLSYSQDGQIPSKTTMEILRARGKVDLFRYKHKRYRSSALPHKGSDVTEYLYCVRMG